MLLTTLAAARAGGASKGTIASSSAVTVSDRPAATRVRWLLLGEATGKIRMVVLIVKTPVGWLGALNPRTQIHLFLDGEVERGRASGMPQGQPGSSSPSPESSWLWRLPVGLTPRTR